MKSVLNSLFLLRKIKKATLLLSAAVLCTVLPAQAQYFGKNKVKYQNFDFDVLESPHFSMYHYMEDSTARSLLKASERWYATHQKVLQDTIKFRNPIIFYNNHADFQQTTAISGAISIGTGGVTEGMKNRVVMPVMDSWSKTDHVLGHELVHAFQYNILKNGGDSLSLQNIRNLPLWMVEGLAEYMSLGRQDAHTAMWMRNAVYTDDIPTLKDLSTNPKYFPYRYGQAFWAFVTGVWGDDVIKPLFVKTAKFGLNEALRQELSVNAETFSGLWAEAMKRHYTRLFPDSVEQTVGTKLLYGENSGDMNLAPALSPDGEKLIFLSEKNLFSIDIFLADAETGEIEREIYSMAKNGHIDDYNYIEASGTWSPDSRLFAFTTVSKGKNKLVIVDAEKGKVKLEFFADDLPAFTNPSWSPDGRQLLVTGQKNGQTDLYLLQTNGKEEVVQLTDDIYAELQPKWSADGKKVVFSTDQLSIENGSESGKYSFNLALLDVATNAKKQLNIFPEANNLNPVFAAKDQEVLFLSNRDGFRNLYSYDLQNEKVYQLTNFITGISGITEFSPALSYTESGQQVAYTHYNDQKYTIYRATLDKFKRRETGPMATDFSASLLPPANPDENADKVNHLLAVKDDKEPLRNDSIEQVPYKPQFKLDYIGNTGVGVAASRFGTGVAGGVEALASDILGNNQVFTSLSVNGEIYDFGGVLAYLNKSSRFHWGASVSHIPYMYPLRGYTEETVDGELYGNRYIDVQRIFQDQIGVFAYFPFSQSLRLEAGISQMWFYSRVDRLSKYYTLEKRIIEGDTVNVPTYRVFENREKQESPEGYQLQRMDVALVHDNSYFGLVGPLRGSRYRLGLEQSFGRFRFFSLTADYRKYWLKKPLTIAWRGFHHGRYGQDAASGSMYQIFLGFPGYMHGIQDMLSDDPEAMNSYEQSDFYGSKIFMTNLEFRLPFTGPEKLALIESKYLLSELNLFFDAGLMLNNELQFGNQRTNEGVDFVANADTDAILNKTPVFSTGLGLRINVFGQMIIEPYYAFPFTPGRFHKGSFGLNFTPAW